MLMSSVFLFGRKHRRTLSQTSGGSLVDDRRSISFSATSSNEELIQRARRELQSGDLGFSNTDSEGIILKRKSRLAKSLTETLSSSAALPYFIQFMEASRVDHLLKFWLAAEIFRVASTSREPLPFEPDTPEVCGDCDKNSCDTGGAVSPPKYFRNGHLASDSSGTQTTSEHLSAQRSARSELLEKTVLEDAKKIYSQYISQEAQFPIGVTNNIRNDVVDRLCGEKGYVDPACFCTAQSFVFRIMEERYFPEFCKSVYHTFHQIDVLTSGNVYLSDIIYDTNALLSFNEFLELEGALKYGEFLLCAENFAEDLRRQVADNKYDSAMAQEDAMIIYNKYVTMQPDVKSAIGFPDEVRSALENSICREGGPLPDCFDAPVQIVWRLLEERYLPIYLDSNGFARYLGELRSTIQNHIELPPTSGAIIKSRKGSGSNSEYSVQSCPVDGFTPPFRATKNRQPPTAAKDPHSLLSVDVRLDKRSSDPDSLWKRDSQSNLSLGRVDSLGQYRREFDDELLSKPKGSKISVAVKNFVKPNKDKEEEAKLVAESIMAEIAQMTTQIGMDSD